MPGRERTQARTANPGTETRTTNRRSTRIGGSRSAKRASTNHSGVTTEVRRRMISEAAYYRAEHRHFQGGDPDQDWYEAELDIEERLGSEDPLQDD